MVFNLSRNRSGKYCICPPELVCMRAHVCGGTTHRDQKWASQAVVSFKM